MDCAEPSVKHYYLYLTSTFLFRAMVTTKIANQPISSETTRNQPKPPATSRKPFETTSNYLKPTQNFPKLAITSPTALNHQLPHLAASRQFLPCFSVAEFEHESIVRKVQSGKVHENPSNDHESQIMEPFLKL